MRATEFITEDINTLINKFKDDHADSIVYGCKRNNCGVPAADLVSYGKKHGYDITRVYGAFIVDNPEFHFDDFTPQERTSMLWANLNPKSKADRIKFAEKNNLVDELKRVPHYWNEHNGQIIDLTGHAQFVKTGLARDLNPDRYSHETVSESTQVDYLCVETTELNEHRMVWKRNPRTGGVSIKWRCETGPRKGRTVPQVKDCSGAPDVAQAQRMKVTRQRTKIKQARKSKKTKRVNPGSRLAAALNKVTKQK